MAEPSCWRIMLPLRYRFCSSPIWSASTDRMSPTFCIQSWSGTVCPTSHAFTQPSAPPVSSVRRSPRSLTARTPPYVTVPSASIT
eukprot:3107662-Pyramimonas_sp.AAC.1